MAERKAIHGHKSMTSSPKLTLLPLPPYLPTTESDTKPLIMHESLRRSTSHLVALDNIRPLAPWKGQQFILNKIDMFSKCEFTFHICFESDQHLYSGAHRASDSLTWDLPHTVTSDQGTEFMKKDSVVGTCLCDSLVLLHSTSFIRC